MLGWFRGGRRQGRSAQIPTQPQAAKDWGVGDVAKCIAPNSVWTFIDSGAPAAGPRPAQLLRVVHVLAFAETVWLGFAGFQGLYPAGHFRKLRTCTTDFREQLRQPVSANTRELVP